MRLLAGLPAGAPVIVQLHPAGRAGAPQGHTLDGSPACHGRRPIAVANVSLRLVGVFPDTFTFSVTKS